VIYIFEKKYIYTNIFKYLYEYKREKAINLTLKDNIINNIINNNIKEKKYNDFRNYKFVEEFLKKKEYVEELTLLN
jgi:hypothetical protein